MTPRDEGIRDAILEWIDKAEDDYVSAERLLSHVSPRTGPIAFLSQQCAEKYLKTFLVAHQVEFPKTHDIKDLLELIATVDDGLAEALAPARKLTPYSVDVRYPGSFPDISPELARQTFELASNVRDSVREILGGFVSEEPSEAPEGG